MLKRNLDNFNWLINITNKGTLSKSNDVLDSRTLLNTFLFIKYFFHYMYNNLTWNIVSPENSQFCKVIRSFINYY